LDDEFELEFELEFEFELELELLLEFDEEFDDEFELELLLEFEDEFELEFDELLLANFSSPSSARAWLTGAFTSAAVAAGRAACAVIAPAAAMAAPASVEMVILFSDMGCFLLKRDCVMQPDQERPRAGVYSTAPKRKSLGSPGNRMEPQRF
jgi:hypothetical protein